MTINPKHFRVREGEGVNLRKWPTMIDPVCKSEAKYAELLAEHVAKLSAMQQLHYATNDHAILLIFQAMDAAGKDGVIRHVMSGVNPQGCQVFSFKHPGATELEHDFLWRTNRDLPERGRIGIFNRSYYEEVLIVQIFGWSKDGRALRKMRVRGLPSVAFMATLTIGCNSLLRVAKLLPDPAPS